MFFPDPRITIERRAVLRIRIWDPVLLDPLDLGSGMGKNQRSGSRMNIPDHIYFLELRHHNYGLKYLNSLMRIRD